VLSKEEKEARRGRYSEEVLDRLLEALTLLKQERDNGRT
jgi:hypothetical protein